MRKTALIALVTAALGFGIGRVTLRGRIAELEARTQHAEHAREIADETHVDAVARVVDGVSAARAERAAAPVAVPSAVPPTTTLSPAEEMSALMTRLTELSEKLDFGSGSPVDDKVEHERISNLVRDDFFAKAQLDAGQRAALDPIVAKLDASLKDPLDRLAALEDADHYAVSDWAAARSDVYASLAGAEQSLRAVLSPQQREALDKTDFSLASQLGGERYEALIGRGLFTPTEPPGDAGAN